MSIRGVRPRPSAPRPDDGYVMITVIGTMLILSILVTLTLNWTTQATKSGRSEQDHSAALSAAQAGVDAYLSRLNADPTSYNPTASCNLACTTNGSATLPNGGTYAWTVLSSTSDIQSSGNIVLQSTGTVRGDKRKVTVTFHKLGFLDYLYFTQYETIDPIATSNGSSAACAVFRYAGRNTTTCPNINFRTGDTLKGSVYSLDSMVISGNPSFQSRFDTAWNGCAPSTGCVNPKLWVDANGTGSTPSFAVTPTQKTLQFPTTNSSLRAQAANPSGGGCLYKGPTRIYFNPTGTMTVTSPYSGSTNPGCGTFSTTAPTQTVNVPANNVIWVDGVTSTPNCTSPAGVKNLVGFPITNDDALTQGNNKLVYSCGNGDAFVEGWLKGRVTIGTANNIIITGNLRYAGKNASAVGTAIPTSGTASPNAADTSDNDTLGLAATNFVEVYHPVTCTPASSGGRDASNNCLSGTDVTGSTATTTYPQTSIQIDAVLLATADSFIVQSWNKGSPMSALTVIGGIIQFFRGPVGTSSGTSVATGYVKNYNYDSRLFYNPPPYLADLTSTKWTATTFGEGTP